MTTRPSSSPAECPDGLPALVDAKGFPIQLAARIGRGGEGTVYGIKTHPTLAVKLYHRRPLDPQSTAKMLALLRYALPDVNKVSAWPRAIAFDAQTQQPCGLVLPLISSSRGLHELYGTVSRRKHFPETHWQHLVLAARNTAAAFATLHEHGIVVGDVNQGNLLVDKEMCVRFIDCDSFQIRTTDTLFKCPVGTPHFTPPELQSVLLETVERTVSHDGFGLAVLIFHLLFVGRHPFASRVQGSTDLPIEAAISQRLFAYSKQVFSDQLQPPLFSLLLDDIPRPLADMFEAAFRESYTNGKQRPPATQWAEELERLLRSEKRCELDASHIHWKELRSCPWCRIETQGGPSYFLAVNRSETIWEDQVIEIERQLHQLSWAQCPHVEPETVVVPRMPESIAPEARLAVRAVDIVCGVAATATLSCVVGLIAPPLMLPAALAALGSAGYLCLHAPSRQLRRHVRSLNRELVSLQSRMRVAGGYLLTKSEEMGRQFQNLVAPLLQALHDYRLQGSELLTLARENEATTREAQRTEYFQQYRIRDQVDKISRLTMARAVMLERYGIETADDIDPYMLQGIPNISASLQIDLVNWRNQLAANLAAQPHAVRPVEDTQQYNAALIRDFKVHQAQKILLETKRIKVDAQKLHAELVNARKVFDKLGVDWRSTANKLYTTQRERRRLERWINHPFVPISIVLWGLLSAALAVYWLVR